MNAVLTILSEEETSKFKFKKFKHSENIGRIGPNKGLIIKYGVSEIVFGMISNSSCP